MSQINPPPGPPMPFYAAYARTQYLLGQLIDALEHEVACSGTGTYQWVRAKQRLEAVRRWPGLPRS